MKDLERRLAKLELAALSRQPSLHDLLTEVLAADLGETFRSEAYQLLKRMDRDSPLKEIPDADLAAAIALLQSVIAAQGSDISYMHNTSGAVVIP